MSLSDLTPSPQGTSAHVQPILARITEIEAHVSPRMLRLLRVAIQHPAFKEAVFICPLRMVGTGFYEDRKPGGFTVEWLMFGIDLDVALEHGDDDRSYLIEVYTGEYLGSELEQFATLKRALDRIVKMRAECIVKMRTL